MDGKNIKIMWSAFVHVITSDCTKCSVSGVFLYSQICVGTQQPQTHAQTFYLPVEANPKTVALKRGRSLKAAAAQSSIR